ncbi:putative DNA-binding transcriptional regulator YafY [Saccharothrix tamanrassetensis]|uniref:Putative DNA-binding transcriptional regulator YafY n=1 Tax=Saccharothrix tamanrassetensis TaxID=1051531 RepID=A0A841CNJ9_9PSEU|nr:YafY family protein [Saccharothrix tamanrassetensis]MBB5959231.1 putative DNA-binding transcriptional regulator YafY [Saccharothrix tamanrassetensis]
MNMPARMLRLLSLLQGRREWTGGELADRLGVTDRTVRRDIERLRELGYPVAGTTGTAGGYRLSSGTDLPPLLLEDDEAVAVAVGLRTAAGVAGIDESAVRALAKLEQVLPDRLRRRIRAVGTAIARISLGGGPVSDPAALGVLAAACRDREMVRFTHRGVERKVEPRNLVTAFRQWYLLAFDPSRQDWRTFRLDRIGMPVPIGLRFPARELPEEPAAFVARALASAPYRFTATALVRAPADVVEARLMVALPGKVEPVSARTCRVHLRANTIEPIAADLLLVAADYTLDASGGVREALAAVAGKLTGTRPDPPGAPGSR